VQLLELLILAALAAVVLYQLYAVLGRRVGRQPDETLRPQPVGRADEADARLREPEEPAPAGGLAGLQARDPSFDPARFLQGARGAYETIVRAFAAGDREGLARLVSPTVLAGFEKAIAARDAEGRTETVEFTHPPRADLDSGEVNGDTARARVRFLAEFRSRTKGPEGEAVDDRRTAEFWTFERRLSSRDPNWTLVRVDEANA
jgi:predicted lipid-binding transport protein (Tim44 family)